MSVIKSAFAIAVVRSAGCLPLGLAHRVGHLAGRVSWLLKTSMAKVTLANITLCFPELSESEQQDLAKKSLKQTGALALETCVLYSRQPQWIQSQFKTLEGEEHLAAALDSGKGVLVIAPHLGNWEILGCYLAQRGQITNMYRQPRLASIDRLVRHSRQRSGAALVPTSGKGLAMFLKALKRGEMGGILPDQSPRDNNAGIFTPFFGQNAFTMTLVYKLIQRSGCVALFAYAERLESGYRIVLKPAAQEIYSEDELESVCALNAGVEECVREVPDQYQWEYKRFRKKPPSA